MNGANNPALAFPHPADHHRRIAAARTCQKLSILAGLMLASAFFMPAITINCTGPPGTDIIPAHEFAGGFWEAINQSHTMPPPTLPERALGFIWFALTYVAAYLLAALASIAAAMTCWGSAPWAWRGRVLLRLACLAVAIGIAIISACVGGLTLFRGLQTGFVAGDWFYEACSLCGIAALIHWFFIRRLRDRVLVAQMFAIGAGGLVWFVPYLIAHSSSSTWRYGLLVSILASAALAILSVIEVAFLTRTGLFRTFFRLLFATLRPHHFFDSMQCANCGYSLIGLPTPRCPECGQGFDRQSTPPLAGREGT